MMTLLNIFLDGKILVNKKTDKFPVTQKTIRKKRK